MIQLSYIDPPVKELVTECYFPMACTEPSVRLSRIPLPPWVFDGEALIGGGHRGTIRIVAIPQVYNFCWLGGTLG